MFEKIKSKLLLQREKTSNVSDRSLEDLAKSLEKVITTDEQLNLMDLAPFIKSLDGNISHYTAEQVRKQKEADEAEKARKQKEEEDKRKTEGAGKTTQTTEDVPEYVKEMMEQIKTFAEQNATITAKLANIEAEKTTLSRSEQLEAIVKDLPSFVAEPIRFGFKRTKFESEDEFKTYLNEITTTKDTFIQNAKENGVEIPTPLTNPKKVEKTNQTPELKNALELVQKQKELEQSKK